MAAATQCPAAEALQKTRARGRQTATRTSAVSRRRYKKAVEPAKPARLWLRNTT
uniref:Uncharacterized protein n=2 Tax=Tetraselmis sp. GSL018 TaxID=582737 RepID=A0A061QLJ0_9CHLO